MSTLLDTVILDVAFQPIIGLADGAIFGYEALGRPRRSDGRPLPIAALLDRARTDGQLLALDRALRRRALERIAERPRDSDLRWFLNVDSRCVDAPGFAGGFTRRVLGELGLVDLKVVIELGEHDPRLDAKRVAAMYPSYASQGFAIALDDFGVGHATLSRLLEVRPGFVKLDRALIDGVVADPMAASLVKALAAFAAEVGITLIAEGIEREEVLQAVVAAGVPLGQGYLLGRPGPLPEGAGLKAAGRGARGAEEPAVRFFGG